MLVAEFVFWSAVFLVGFSYVVYPLLLAVLTRSTPEDGKGGGTRAEDFERPAVALIVAAYNEERHIEARIDNALSQSYDPNKLTVYVGSDGSQDRTGALIESRSGDRVRSFVFHQNRGKATVLNELAGEAREPILVFSDANTMFAADAVELLVARLCDGNVGVVCGELKLLDARKSNKDSAYWRLEQFLKRAEARLGGLLGANGGIYAIRREVFSPIPSDTIIDDFCIAMTAAAKGWALAYEPNAVATEETPDEISDEYHRRVRIGIGNYQALFRHPEYLLQTNWMTRLSYVSHKILRWFTPHLMAMAFLASAFLAPHSTIYLALLVVQIAIYSFGVIIWRFRLQDRLPGPAAMLFFFLTLNWAFLVAFVRYMTGRYSGRWRTTLRSAEKRDSSAA